MATRIHAVTLLDTSAATPIDRLTDVLGMTVWESAGRKPVTTVQLNNHFIAPGRLGELIIGRGEVLRATRSVVFIRGMLTQGDKVRIRRHGNQVILEPVADDWAWLDNLPGKFDDDFIELARSVYKRNDERAAIKREINSLLDSEIVEEKSYLGRS